MIFVLAMPPAAELLPNWAALLEAMINAPVKLLFDVKIIVPLPAWVIDPEPVRVRVLVKLLPRLRMRFPLSVTGAVGRKEVRPLVPNWRVLFEAIRIPP